MFTTLTVQLVSTLNVILSAHRPPSQKQVCGERQPPHTLRETIIFSHAAPSRRSRERVSARELTLWAGFRRLASPVDDRTRRDLKST